IYIAVLAFGMSMGMVAYLILLERKVASWAQDRLGPNRVGFGFGLPFMPKFHFWGLGQPMADGLKFLVKEDYRPSHVDKVLFSVAPIVMMLTVVVSLVAIPWGGTKVTTHRIDVTASHLAGESDANIIAYADKSVTPSLPWYSTMLKKPQAVETVTDSAGTKHFITFVSGWRFQSADLSIGLLFILASLSLAVYGIVVGGWASNNKFSFLGALRATANMISYEIPLGLSVLIVVLMFGTLDLARLVEDQARYWYLGPIPIPAWNVFAQPLAFVLFLICIHAEANRAPFDLAEAEQELVGGYHTEYSSMRFALFFLSEYAGMITTSCVCIALFFGGWHMPGMDWAFNKITGTQPVPGGQIGWTESLVLCFLRMCAFFGKAAFVLFLFMWVRWSLPRFRFDQLMRLAWGGLIPIGIGLLVATAVVVYLTRGASYTNWMAARRSISW
ncbi:MAG: NADH-quinone oxidoreductase subunit H, partial [Burkholderiales bacterium]|nr:NADH-quinone oxidoreductase subunit H [Phycisphaerae bacterium]